MPVPVSAALECHCGGNILFKCLSKIQYLCDKHGVWKALNIFY